MTPYRSKGAKTFKVRVYGSCCLSRPRRCKKAGHVRTTHIEAEDDARELGKLLRKMRAREKYWPILDALIDRRLGAADVLAAYNQRMLPKVFRSLSDVDLEPLVDQWHRSLKGKVAQDTRDHYLSAVRFVIPAMKVFPRSRLTPDFLQDAVDGWDVTPGTARKRGMGIRRFTKWLRRKKIIRRDPMADVELPRAGKPRDYHLEPWEALRLADAQPSPYREFSAILNAGVEVSALLEVRRRDVDTKNREIRAPGTKTWNRDRVVRVPEYVWPYVLRAIAGLHPDTKLFHNIPDRWEAQWSHKTAIYGIELKGEMVGGLVEQVPRLKGYTMRDARHTYAVRAIRAGTPAEIVARQLGHKDAVLVHRVYGKYAPKQEERDKWEKAATAADSERKQESQQ